MKAGWPSHGSRLSAGHPCHDFAQFCACLGFSERQPDILSVTEPVGHPETWPYLQLSWMYHLFMPSLHTVWVTMDHLYPDCPARFISHLSHWFCVTRKCYQQSSDFFFKMLTKMSLRIGQVEDLCKTSLGNHLFNKESPFIFHYILRLNTLQVFILSVCILQVFCHCSFLVRKCMVNQVFYGSGSICYFYAVTPINHLWKSLKISHWVP